MSCAAAADFALFRRKFCERAANRRSAHAFPRFGPGVVIDRGGLLVEFRRAFRDDRAAPQFVDAPVAHNRKQPSPGCTARGIEVSRATPERDERVLHGVFGRIALTDHAHGERAGKSAVTRIQRIERAAVAARHAHHQCRIGPKLAAILRQGCPPVHCA